MANAKGAASANMASPVYDHTFNAKVSKPIGDNKNVIDSSFIADKKTKDAAAIIPPRNSGKVTLKNDLREEYPNDLAASSSCGGA